MFVWLFWLSPPPPVEPTTQEDPITDTSAVPTAPDLEVQEGDDLATDLSETVIDSTIAGARDGTERRITIETDLYEAVFSTKGATLTSFILKEYNKFDQETPVQLIDTTG